MKIETIRKSAIAGLAPGGTALAEDGPLGLQ